MVIRIGNVRNIYVYYEVYIFREVYVCRLINVWFCKNFLDNKIIKCVLDFSNVSIRFFYFFSKKLFYGVFEIKIFFDEGFIKKIIFLKYELYF